MDDPRPAANPRSVAAAVARCARFVHCIRRPDAARLESESYDTYKKGFEVRFAAASPADLNQLRRLLSGAGLKPGRPYKKANRWIQPVYGRAAVGLFDH